MSVKKSLAALFVLGVGSVAFAHPGHDAATLVGGALHPLTGLDHLLAMLAVGLWASQQRTRAARILIPVSFVAAMLLGGALTFAGVHLPAFLDGYGTNASVLVLGLMIACAVRLPLAAGMALTAAFAVCHGYAHAQHLYEVGAGGAAANPMGYACGFLLATACLHLLGFGIGAASGKFGSVKLVRAAGVATAALAIVCFVQM